MRDLIWRIAIDLVIPSEQFYFMIVDTIVREVASTGNFEGRVDQGRVDLVLPLENLHYRFEFVVDDSAAEALDRVTRTETECLAESGETSTGTPPTWIKVGVRISTSFANIKEWEYSVDPASLDSVGTGDSIKVVDHP